ncbi:mannose-1-phosphate guanylyltransferase [Serinicoccus chungangensis]|uniref:Mannose-1-phosphate guanylyltransferase n=1 Tax=Serinicoccus chungangensis TaxID=767452 RepID=A0A0W8II42_9MICO|nr:mannose-1-phosphate guanylyltransferase [Serinicoccus chungangensis]KUG59328.1 mannose-1-phosphate guanylyltransferase [Serinicoccus chungangensis]
MSTSRRAAGSLDDAVADLTAVVPAGGSGTRLWPLSRSAAPKFLQDLTGSGRSMLQGTVDRVGRLVGGRVLVVTGRAHAAAVRRQLGGLPEDRLLLEPSPRDSMPAIGWAAAVLERSDPDAVLGSFAADHVIEDEDAFADCVRQAVVAARRGSLVTLGVQPRYPATGFGYVEVGERRPSPGAPDAHRVVSFVEKPDRSVAERYLEGGRHLWNAGIFVVRAGVLLDLLADQHPEMVHLLRLLARDPGRLDEVWGSLPAVAIDRAVAEPAARAGVVEVVPADLGWDDLGDFASLATLLQEHPRHAGVRVLGSPGDVLAQDSTGLVAARGGRTVVTLGVEGVVVVDTPDALLVTSRERCQDVRSVVAALEQLGREDLT